MFRISGPEGEIRLGRCVVDRGRRVVRRGLERVHISRKAFQLLEILLDARPRVVPKDELRALLWPTEVVVERNLANLVAEVRAALEESAKRQVCLKTVHGYGYAIETADQSPLTDGDSPPSCWLVYERRHITLPEGQHLVGRHPRSVVLIGDPTVSRRHARIDVVWCPAGGGGDSGERRLLTSEAGTGPSWNTSYSASLGP